VRGGGSPGEGEATAAIGPLAGAPTCGVTPAAQPAMLKTENQPKQRHPTLDITSDRSAGQPARTRDAPRDGYTQTRCRNNDPHRRQPCSARASPPARSPKPRRRAVGLDRRNLRASPAGASDRARFAQSPGSDIFPIRDPVNYFRVISMIYGSPNGLRAFDAFRKHCRKKSPVTPVRPRGPNPSGAFRLHPPDGASKTFTADPKK
jgi:hypothetical protein